MSKEQRIEAVKSALKITSAGTKIERDLKTLLAILTQ